MFHCVSNIEKFYRSLIFQGRLSRSSNHTHMINRSKQYYIKGSAFQMIIKNTLATIQIYYKIRYYIRMKTDAKECML